MSARSLNKVMLIGNLTRDPELRYTPKGTAVCSFGLATNRSWMPTDATERREETEFHRIVAWNKLAELCSQLLTKGRKVYIEGRLQTRSWESPDGEKRQATEIVAEDMVILDSRRQTEGEGFKPAEDKGERSEESKDESNKEKEDNKEADKKEEKEDKKKEDPSTSSGQEKTESKKEKAEKKDDKSPPAGGDDEIDIDDIPF